MDREDEEIFTVIVEFKIAAPTDGPWTGEQCAVDYLKHIIDEEYMNLRREQVIDWQITSCGKTLT